MSENLVEVKHLQQYFPAGGMGKNKQYVQAVDDVSFAIRKGETLGLVGESGCGKSTTAMGIMQLIKKPGRIAGGAIHFDGKDLLKLSADEMTEVRGKKIGIIFQNPLDSLNPVYTVGYQMTEGLLVDKMDKKEAYQLACDMLRDVKISDVEERMKTYPHEISGGMRQRVIIAIALAANPKLIIADEPTTALDVTIQAQILKLMDKLVKEQDASLILITHDLAVVSQMADRIIVMYCGKIVESGSRDDVIRRPSHPYTEGLLNSIPRMGEEQKRLESIPGMVPSMLDLPQGCYFAPRCKYCQDICRTVAPENHEVGPGHCAACHFPLTGGESHE